MGYDRLDLRGLISLLACAALLLAACLPSTAAPQPTTPPAPTLDAQSAANPLFNGTEPTPARVYAQGAWSLYIYFRARGTRSEGQHGVLFHNGQAVPPAQPGATLQTELGEMKYYLDPADMINLWDTTGWNFADSSLIKRWEK